MNKPMENKNWREQYPLTTFTGETRKEIEPLIESILKSKQEEIEGKIESIYQRRKMQLPSHSVANIRGSEVMCEIERDEDAKSIWIAQNSRTDGYNQALEDLKPIISNILK